MNYLPLPHSGVSFIQLCVRFSGATADPLIPIKPTATTHKQYKKYTVVSSSLLQLVEEEEEFAWTAA